tara:strand:- start:10357 stop:10860 length:504 start_codon:yes stop_codon:yes gene_type:complete
MSTNSTNVTATDAACDDPTWQQSTGRARALLLFIIFPVFLIVGFYMARRRYALAYRIESLALFIASISLEAFVVGVLVAVWASFVPCLYSNCYTPGCDAYELSFYIFIIVLGAGFFLVAILRYFGVLRGLFRRKEVTSAEGGGGEADSFNPFIPITSHLPSLAKIYA